MRGPGGGFLGFPRMFMSPRPARLPLHPMSFSAVGQVFDLPAFRAHVASLDLRWASAVCIHHTASPSLAMRPKGWTVQHMRNLAHYYGAELGWSAGPHLFTDEDQVFGLSPLTSPGIHAASFNRSAIGIEALGDYDSESPSDGRGALVWQTTVNATAILLDRLGLEATGTTVLFHRDDPKTKKTCPGRKVDKKAFLDRVAARLKEIRNIADREDSAAIPVATPVDKIALARDLLRQVQELLT